MRPIKISCICITYGRVALLQESLACFLSQTYPDRELIIWNSLADQKLVFQHSLVKIVNSDYRPKTLGETRNHAITEATGDLMVCWDADDLYLENHLSNFLKTGFDPKIHGWVRHDKQFHSVAWRIKAVTHGTCNTWAFTKEAWKAVGGYNELNTGEDAHFMGRVCEKYQGLTVNLAPHEISFIYGFGQGTFHVSGNGPDVAGKATATERAADWIAGRLKTKYEPKGVVVLQPQLQYDYTAQARAFTGGTMAYQQKRRGQVGIVQLGSAGDIFNILPIAKRIADRHQKPKLFVSRVYAPMLEGVSYVEAMPIDLPPHCLKEALREAEARCEYVINTQQFGHNFNPPRHLKCYNRDEWQAAGMAHLFDDRVNMPLVIDRREQNREQVLYDSVKTDKPMLLVMVTGGHTAKWPDGQHLLAKLRETFSDRLNIVDMATKQAVRIFDMLGLMDKAIGLVSSDTYTLHLSPASAVPVIAILNDVEIFHCKWLKSALRCNVRLELEYKEGLKRYDEIKQSIEGLIP